MQKRVAMNLCELWHRFNFEPIFGVEEIIELRYCLTNYVIIVTKNTEKHIIGSLQDECGKRSEYLGVFDKFC